MIWLLGSALFAHVVAFFGVNYFDQARVAWFAMVAMICACTTPLLRSSATPPNVVVHLHVPEAGSLPGRGVSAKPSLPRRFYRFCAG